MIHILCGPPCAGKSSYIDRHAAQHDIVIDADRIAAAMGGRDHMNRGPLWRVALAARSAAINKALETDADCWIIDSQPDDATIDRYIQHGADIKVLDPGKTVCTERAASRPDGTVPAIERWYDRLENASAFSELHKSQTGRNAVKLPTVREATPYKSVAEKGQNMKRTDITALFPEATDEQIKTLMDLNGADINNAKKGVTDLQTRLTAAQSRITELENKTGGDDLTAAQERAQALQTELDGLKAANALRDMRTSVAKDTGVPAELITAETEEAARAQAQSILDFAKSNGYPALKDGGEPGTPPKLAPRDRFAAWAEGKL